MSETIAWYIRYKESHVCFSYGHHSPTSTSQINWFTRKTILCFKLELILIAKMKYNLPLLPMLAAMVAHPAMGAPAALEHRQDDWNGEQTGGLYCDSQYTPVWADCKSSLIL